ncbi:MAG TPA: hypothetical protein VG963_12325 [Polyangiaceae bacterium]|nr:hypothetical protein [Polyangiaceae bacterium]
MRFSKHQRQLIETAIRAFKQINDSDPRVAVALHQAMVEAVNERGMRRSVKPVRDRFEAICVKQMADWCRAFDAMKRSGLVKEAA